MKTMICLLLSHVGFTAYAQEFTRSVQSFTQIIVSPHISVILKKGNEESVRFKYSGVDEDRINIEVSNRKLHLYLDNARITEDDDFPEFLGFLCNE
jgi:HSP20 family molecular chaperone IbpA